METLISLVGGASTNFQKDDDMIDRFHHQYTVILLVVFAVVSTTHQLVGDPISCWAPDHFESSWKKYANTYCWVQNTYFLPFEEEIPKPHEQRDEIVYYQWIPFIFLGMAIFFYLPSVVWTSFNSKAGVDSDNILETAENFRHTEKLESKEKSLRLITNQLDRFVGSTPKTLGGMTVEKGSAISRNLFCLCGRKFGNYLVILYLFTKVLYIANVVGQLFALNSVLETDFNIFGVQAIKGFVEDEAFLNHTIFPKVTMCDFYIRTLGNNHRYTVQCLLTINLYTEKMFVFLWFWMVFVLLMTVVSLVMWIVRSALPADRYGFVEESLILMDRLDRGNQKDQALCWRFVHEYLRLDGVFVLRMVGHNTNRITSSEIIASLWDNWLYKTNTNRERIDEPDISNIDTMPMKPRVPLKPGFRPHANAPPPPPEKPPLGSKFRLPATPSAPNNMQYT